MREKLTEYLNDLFQSAPDTPKNRELREELLQNSLDKYDDLVKNGTSEAAAFNLVVGGLGDVTVLLREIHAANAAPTGAGAQGSPQGSPLGSAQGSVQGSPQSDRDAESRRQKWTTCLVTAIMLYIVSIVPPILFGSTRFSASLGPALMFVIIAIATGILLYGVFTFKKNIPVNVQGESKPATKNDPLFASLNGLLWAIVLVLYFVISFASGSWHITWLLFPIGAALSGVLKAIFDLVGGSRK